MAAIPPFKDLRVEDYPEQSGWIGRLFEALNVPLRALVASLAHGLTFQDNLAAEVKDLTFNAALATYPLRVKLERVSKVRLVWPGYCRELTSTGSTAAVTAALHVDWTQEGNQLAIQGIVGLDSAKRYSVTLVVSGG